MTQVYRIAGYCRISVDEELDRDNVSIENQKSIIREYVRTHFPGSELHFSRTAIARATRLSSARGISGCAGCSWRTSWTC